MLTAPPGIPLIVLLSAQKSIHGSVLIKERGSHQSERLPQAGGEVIKCQLLMEEKGPLSSGREFR